MDDAHKLELTKIGRAFREVREQRGLSQREVADAVRYVVGTDSSHDQVFVQRLNVSLETGA
jgi:transcriptional regulator with XRE-family HTH domain